MLLPLKLACYVVMAIAVDALTAWVVADAATNGTVEILDAVSGHICRLVYFHFAAMVS